MKKIFFVAILFIAIAGCKNSTTSEDALKKQIADLENQIIELKKEEPGTEMKQDTTLKMKGTTNSCSLKYFDSETELRKFIAANYKNTSYNYNTVAVNTKDLKTSLAAFPENTTTYISIIHTSVGREYCLSSNTNICLPGRPPRGICCPPNCPPPRIASIALYEMFNPFRNY